MLSDFKRVLVLLVIAVGLAFLINQLRSEPLGMVYTTPAQQMETAPKGPGIDANAPPITVVGIDQVIKAATSRTHLIIDARPDLFWEIGHIPGAISLPRKQLAEYYPKTESLLREAVAAGRPLLLYCADLHCPDAGALAKELNQRGFNGLLLFEAGWAAWEEAGQAVETK
jgi:rhodanese-related sulfurtransferase